MSRRRGGDRGQHLQLRAQAGRWGLGAGWYHGASRGLAGVPEPRRADGRGEYQAFLEEVGSGDDFRSNTEVEKRFFDANGKLRPDMARALSKDISVLVIPSPERALALDRAYLGLVLAQSFAKGRDVVLGAPHVHRRVEQDTPTGIQTPIEPSWKVPEGVASR
ncbi:Hypothetical protein A7982_10119 [Minicystis rosea]|nr:Hypothetical protein A7982_10119 [Minicystis rosea]